MTEVIIKGEVRYLLSIKNKYLIDTKTNIRLTLKINSNKESYIKSKAKEFICKRDCINGFDVFLS